ncbi:hypothetical protein [Flavobacterium xinjiangense]|uniref:Uncharacterized protein n=1 Tax=Flavobacterium xinjiangense TaxID=178356 RepID=A0A1M7MFU5_9FLAO|nr:hypothetical protein [Flavobacterium xinjiangense]SHM89714.1 hypothetical protein SAMN05216269_108112 [Flavobacterium xinjiangense]
MKTYLQIAFFLVIAVSLVYCAPKENQKTKFPQKIKSVYFQKRVDIKEAKNSGTDFYIEFEAPLSKEIQLVKIYFQSQEANFEPITKNIFVAYLASKPTNPDLILHKDSQKEYGNQAPIIMKPKFDLKPIEALLEYKRNGKSYFFKLNNAKEKPMIAPPSVIKPKK